MSIILLLRSGSVTKGTLHVLVIEAEVSYLTGLQVKVNRIEGFPPHMVFHPWVRWDGGPRPKMGVLAWRGRLFVLFQLGLSFFQLGQTGHEIRCGAHVILAHIIQTWDWKSLLRLQDFAQTTRLFSDYKTLLRLQDFSQTTRLCSDYKTLVGLQNFAQTTRQCSDYKTLLRLQDFTQIARHCSDYRTLLRLQDFAQTTNRTLLRPQDVAQTTRLCPDYKTLPRLHDIAQTTRHCSDFM